MKPYIIIYVYEAGTPTMRTLAFRISFNDRVLEEKELSPVESQEVRAISDQYASLFEKSCRVGRNAARDYFDILGAGMFHIFFETAWEKIEPAIGQAAGLTVASPVSEVLRLPWELLRLPDKISRNSATSETGEIGEIGKIGEAGGTALGLIPGFRISRVPGSVEGITTPSPSLSPGPLRVLFLACDPLDYEQEERGFLKAVQGQNVVFEICDKGSLAELKSRAKSLRPHLVHIIAQAKMKEGKAHLSFSGEEGRPDLYTSEELGRALAEEGLKCAICAGCQTDEPLTRDLFSQGLTDHIPMAVAWNSSAESAKSFYASVASGNLDDAVSLSRLETHKACTEQSKICALPVLYSASAANHQIFDKEREEKIASLEEEQRPLPGMTEGYVLDFADRRRDLQRLVTALREGTAKAVILTGPDGVGKTSLATRLAWIFASEGYGSGGYNILPVYSSRYNPLSAARIMESAINALDAAGMREDTLRLRDHSLALKERLMLMLHLLEEKRFLIFLDGLRLDEKSGKIDDADLAEFYPYLLRHMDRSRAILTCKSLPADAMTLPRKAWEWPLSGLSEAAFIRFLLRDSSLAERYRSGEVQYEKLLNFHLSVAGLPACITFMARALSQGMDADICDEFLAKLLEKLKPESRQALCRASVYETAISLAGLAAVAGVPEDGAKNLLLELQDLSLAYSAGNLWSVPSQARPFLLNLQSPEERRSAHRSAGSFLREMAESGRAKELGLSRLDCLMEARGQYLAYDDTDQARTITARICGYLERRGYYYQIIRLNEEVLRKERHSGPMSWIARAYLDQGRYSEAEKWYSQAMEAGPNATACHGLGTVYFRQGKYDLARANFEKAAEICKAGGDLEGEASALHSLASIDIEQKNDQAALQKLDRVLKIQERLGDMSGEAMTLNDMATLYLRRGDYDSARQRLVRSQELLKTTGDRQGEAAALFNLASLDMERGEFDLAREEFQRSLMLKREIGDRRDEATILHSLGSIEVQAEDNDKAREKFIEALRIYQDLGDKPGEAGSIFQLGALAVQQARIPEGLRLMALSAVILRSINSDEVKNVEPVVERLASQLKYTQDQFLEMVRKVVSAYRRDRGWGLIEKAFA